MYLEEFTLPERADEESCFAGPGGRRAGYNSYTSTYPFGIFRYRELPVFVLEPITILYGGNGSGKSTILNAMAERMNISRGSVFNRSDFFDDYAKLCKYKSVPGKTIPEDSKIITSDDVFDYMLDLRCINEGIDAKRAELLAKYSDYRMHKYQLRSLDDYDEWRRRTDTHTKAPNKSAYLREHLMDNVRTYSNGESALRYFTDNIKEDALYLLDEPENSLSASLQLKLKTFLEDSVRFFGCQFVISTHSPFLLAIPGAKIYDLDTTPPCVREWTELENVKLYHEFFKTHDSEFKEN